MVNRTPEAYEYSLHEYGLVEKNLALYGDLKFRAQVVRAMQDSVKHQVEQRVRARLAGGDFESTRTIALSHEMTDKIIESLRAPVSDQSAEYVVEREDMRALVDSYDDARREQIISAYQA